ncbi:MAG: hypothetical protein AB2A00_43240 [Myxococcota bacterium]
MASIQSFTLQKRANQLLDSWVKQTQTSARDAATVSKTEAQDLVKQAKLLPQKEVEDLKAAFLARMQKDGFSVTPDAGKIFADFFKMPLEAFTPPATTKRTAVNNAQATKVANETDSRVKINTKELKEQLKNAEQLPANLKASLGLSLLGLIQDGSVKLDPEARKEITRFVAKSGAQDSKKLSNLADGFIAAGKEWGKAAVNAVKQGGKYALVETANIIEGNGGLDALNRSLSMGVQPMSYAQYVMLHGGSFEDILFAFLMQLADKTDKKMLEAIEKMDKQERAEKLRSTDAAKKAIAELGAEDTPATPAPVQGPGGGKVAKVSTQLEAVVQSAHYMVGSKSEGGAQITKAEAARLVGKLEQLPENVQVLLAGAISSAMRRKGLPLQPEAFDALESWGKKVAGDKFDVGDPQAAKDGAAMMPPAPEPSTGLGQALSNSPDLEDKIASFLVDTLVKPDASLKDKIEPFKGMRAKIDEFAQNVGPAQSGPPIPLTPPVPGETGTSASTGPLPAPPPAETRPGKLPSAEDAPPSDAISQNELQRLVQERNRIFDMLSNIMKALHDMIMTSVRNMR